MESDHSLFYFPRDRNVPRKPRPVGRGGELHFRNSTGREVASRNRIQISLDNPMIYCYSEN